MSRNDWLAGCAWAVVLLNILITVVVYTLHITDGSIPHAQLYLCIAMYGVSTFIGMLFGAAGMIMLELFAYCKKNARTIKEVLAKFIIKIERLTSMMRKEERYDHKARTVGIQENQNSAA